MKKINFTYKSFCLALIAFAMAGCSDTVISEDAGQKNSRGGNILVSATVVPPIEDKSALNSRVLSGENENHISNLHVLAFNKAGEMIANGFSDFSMDGQKEFTLNLGVDKADQKVTLFAIANIDNTLIFNSHDMNLETFSHLYVKAENANSLESGTYSIYKSNGEKFCDIINQSSPILISEGTTITVEKDGTTTAQLNLVRQCAKVTLTVHPNDVNIYAYQLRHIPTISYLKNNQENYSDPEFSDVPVKFVEDGENVTDVTFYIYENYNDAVLDITAQKQRNPSKAPADASYINIWGKYNSIEGDEMSTMYRVYLGGVDNEGHQDLKQFTLRRNQNYVYDVTLRQNGTADPRCITGKLKPNYGDFLFSDGSWGPYVKATEKRYPVAIIFSNETSKKDKSYGFLHGYAMALRNVNNGATYLIGNSTNDPGIGIPKYEATWDSVIVDKDGYYYCTTYLDNETAFPAAYNAMHNYTYAKAPLGTSGWYLPSSGQSYELNVNLGGMPTVLPGGYYWNASYSANTCVNNLNSKMDVIGESNYDKFTVVGTWYGLSSQYSTNYCHLMGYSTDQNVYMSTYGTRTSYNVFVRPVIAF